MKIATSVLALILGAKAALNQRDVAAIQKVINDISNSTDALDSAVKAYTGNITGLSLASDKLLAITKSGTDTVVGEAMLPVPDATQMAKSVNALNSSVARTVNDLISKRAAFASANQTSAVLKSLQDLRTAAKPLADALTSKTPNELQPVAALLSKGIDDTLSQGISAFSTTGGSSGGSSSGAAAPTSSSGSQSGSSSKTSSAATTNAVVLNILGGALAAIGFVLAL
jgi:hypothetical protein